MKEKPEPVKDYGTRLQTWSQTICLVKALEMYFICLFWFKKCMDLENSFFPHESSSFQVIKARQ